MDSASGFEDSRRKMARVAGIAFLAAIVVVVAANYAIRFRLIIPNNAVDTARNIRAHQTLFRLNVAGDLLYVFAILVLAPALYGILKPFGRTSALVATFLRLVLAVMWMVIALNALSASRVLGHAGYLQAFEPAQLDSLAKLHLDEGHDAYYLGLPLWGLASTICSYLLLKSKQIPKALASFGLISSAWCVICGFLFIVFPHFDTTVNAYWFDTPLILFEGALGYRLLFRGLRPSESLRHEMRQPA